MSNVELIRSCAGSNDDAAWQEFVRRFQGPISLSIIRTAHKWGQTPWQIVDDLVQETYLKLCADECRLLLQFAVQHPDAVPGYIKMIAINVAHDHFKSLHSQKRGAGETDQFLDDADPPAQSASLGGQEAIEREVLYKQIDACLDKHLEGPDKERDRTIFWLRHQQGMSAKAIATLPWVGLSAKGVESLLARLERLVRERLLEQRSEDAA